MILGQLCSKKMLRRAFATLYRLKEKIGRRSIVDRIKNVSSTRKNPMKLDLPSNVETLTINDDKLCTPLVINFESTVQTSSITL